MTDIMWSSPAELIEAEALQRAESGYEAIAFVGALGPTFDAWRDAPRRADWPYREPDSWDEIRAAIDAEDDPDLTSISEDVLRRGILGAWWGRCVGNCAGKPLEAGRAWSPDTLREYLRSVGNYPFARYLDGVTPFPADIPWVGERSETAAPHLAAVPRDDDLDYTVLGLRVLEGHGASAGTEHFAHEWLTSMPYLSACTAERVAYRNLVGGAPVSAAGDLLNPYREWVGALIRADPIGYAFPGRPLAAARAAWSDAVLSHRANGIYGEMWVASLIALSLVSTSGEHALRRSLAYIPRESRLMEELRSIIADWDAGMDAEQLVRAVHHRHPDLNPVHTINNAGIIAAAVISSDDMFDRALATSISGCLDTDSNAATVGSVLGALVGVEGIDRHWTAPFRDTLRSDIRGFDGASIQSIAERFVAVAFTALRG